jgi:hypothetical protein
MYSPIDFLVSEIRDNLAMQGWCYLPSLFQGAALDDVLRLARALGSLYVPPGTSPTRPFIKTRPAPDADDCAPFDQPGAIGWHSDFSTHSTRPAVSLAWLAQADPLGQGAWRIASCDDVLTFLQSTPEGAATARLLAETELPYSFTRDAAEPAFFRAVEHRGPPPERPGLRFYGRAMRDGAWQAYGTIPDSIERAISAVETAADHVGRTLQAPSGALLVMDNWHALHDRLAQTVDAALPLRCSWLCFIESLHEPLPRRSAATFLPPRP